MRNISCMENIIDWFIRPIIHNGTCHNVGFALIYVIYQYRNKILKCIMNICLIMRDPHEVWSNNDEKDDKVEAVKYWAFKTIKGRKCTCHAHNEKYLWKNISIRHATSFSCDEYVAVNTKSNKLLKQKQFRVVLVVE